MDAVKRYDMALRHADEHGRQLWQAFSVFLVAQSILLGFVLQRLDIAGFVAFRPALFLSSIVGLLLSGIWLVSTIRLWDYYNFYMSRARDAEEGALGDWALLRAAQDLRSGTALDAGEKTFKVSWIGRRASTRHAAIVLVVLFFVAHGVTTFLTGPWMPSLPIDPGTS